MRSALFAFVFCSFSCGVPRSVSAPDIGIAESELREVCSGKRAPGTLACWYSQRAGVPDDASPSATMKKALRSYNDGDYATAAGLFLEVVEGAEDSSCNRQRARFFRAESLYKLKKYRQASLLFGEFIGLGEGSFGYYCEAAKRLKSLAEVDPPPKFIERADLDYCLNDARNTCPDL